MSIKSLVKSISAGRKTKLKKSSYTKAGRKLSKSLEKRIKKQKIRDAARGNVRGQEEVAKYKRTRKLKDEPQKQLHVGWAKDDLDFLETSVGANNAIKRMIKGWGNTWSKFSRKKQRELIEQANDLYNRYN